MGSLDEPTHVIDPDGEVMIVLEDANAPFAVWEEEKKGESQAHEDTSQADTTQSVISEDTKEERYHIQVSAKHLTLASPVFKKLLLGNWKESSSFLEKGSVELTVHDWHFEPLFIFLAIIHCRYHEIPEKVSLELLAQIAVLTDYYACKEIIGFFANLWIKHLETPVPSSHPRDIMLWICIAWVFRLSEHYKTSTSIAMTHRKSATPHLGLPIPKNVLDAMNQKRESAIGGTLAKLQRAQISFLEGKIGCSFDCQSIRLGALQKAMHIKGLYSPEPVAPFPGMDYQSLLATVRSFKVPRCPSNSSYCAGSSGEYYNFGCADAIDGLEIA